jgi:hypothetical protein
MKAFAHDNLDPAISDGDLLVQLCASHRDTVGHAMLDILAHTSSSMRSRWRIDGFRFPPRPVGIPRDWMGFKDGITNPNTTDMNQQVWVQPGAPEPAWTAGGTYQVVRIIRMLLDQSVSPDLLVVSVGELRQSNRRLRIAGMHDSCWPGAQRDAGRDDTGLLDDEARRHGRSHAHRSRTPRWSPRGL